MKAYIKDTNMEVTIIGFSTCYSVSGVPCRYARCFIPELENTEDILLDSIEIGG